jgi:hypothetical protein
VCAKIQPRSPLLSNRPSTPGRVKTAATQSQAAAFYQTHARNRAPLLFLRHQPYSSPWLLFGFMCSASTVKCQKKMDLPVRWQLSRAAAGGWMGNIRTGGADAVPRWRAVGPLAQPSSMRGCDSVPPVWLRPHTTTTGQRNLPIPSHTTFHPSHHLHQNLCILIRSPVTPTTIIEQ